MKTLRYLLIATVMVLMSVTAQAEFKYVLSSEYQFRSTSVLASSGSTLPMAAESGAVVDRKTPGDGTPAYSPGRPRREGEADPFGGQTINDVTNPQDPGSPVGEGVWMLMVLALAYGGYMMFRRRKITQVGI